MLGYGRLPTSKANSDLASQYGVRVADSIQGWIGDGLCFGPLLPWDVYTVNPVTVKLIPNVKAGECINMSAPYKCDKMIEDAPASINSGIDTSKFPATMSSTQSLTSPMRARCPAVMCKLD